METFFQEIFESLMVPGTPGFGVVVIHIKQTNKHTNLILSSHRVLLTILEN